MLVVALLAGRDDDLAELRKLLAKPVPILGLRAPSGTGKSSLLYGGLAATLRAGGVAGGFGATPAGFGRAAVPVDPGLPAGVSRRTLMFPGRERSDERTMTFSVFKSRWTIPLACANRPAVSTQVEIDPSCLRPGIRRELDIVLGVKVGA